MTRTCIFPFLVFILLFLLHPCYGSIAWIDGDSTSASVPRHIRQADESGPCPMGNQPSPTLIHPLQGKKEVEEEKILGKPALSSENSFTTVPDPGAAAAAAIANRRMPFRQSLEERLDVCERAFVTGLTPAQLLYPERLCVGLVGRLLKGHGPADFETLADDPGRQLVFVILQDGLLKLLGKTTYQMMMAIGWTPQNIREMAFERHFQFKLVIFGDGGAGSNDVTGMQESNDNNNNFDANANTTTTNGNDIRPATWENLVGMAGDLYPSVRTKLWQQLPALRQTPLGEIERRAGYSFAAVRRAGPSDPRYVTLERLERGNGTLAEVRFFLYSALYAREYFTGTGGYTPTAGGQRGLREYLLVNRRLAELGPHRLIHLDYNYSAGGHAAHRQFEDERDNSWEEQQAEVD